VTKMTIHRAGPVYSHFSIDEHRAGPVYSLVRYLFTVLQTGLSDTLVSECHLTEKRQAAV